LAVASPAAVHSGGASARVPAAARSDLAALGEDFAQEPDARRHRIALKLDPAILVAPRVIASSVRAVTRGIRSPRSGRSFEFSHKPGPKAVICSLCYPCCDSLKQLKDLHMS